MEGKNVPPIFKIALKRRSSSASPVKLQFARIFVDKLLKQFLFQVMTDTEMFIEVFVEKRTGRTQR